MSIFLSLLLDILCSVILFCILLDRSLKIYLVAKGGIYMKEWKTAEIVELDMSETEYDYVEGTIEDGPVYICDGQWYPGYVS